MNTYQSQQFWNDLNGVVGFATSIILMGFIVGMVKPMGRFFEPARRPEKHLPKPVVKEVTVPGGSYWKCSSCGKELPPGIKVFKAGREVYCSIPCIKLPEHHSSSNITTQEAKGTCYEDAWRFLGKHEDGFLVHGSVQLSTEGPRINHAWVELSTGWVWEPQTKGYITIKDFRVFSPVEHHRYTFEQTSIITARTGNMGPWSEEERAKWLPGKESGHQSNEIPEVVITEIEDNITAHIPGVRATAELSRLARSEVVEFGLKPDKWLWFNRLINQSGIPRIGTLLLDGVLRYCKEKDYSILNHVSAYGDISQKELENWYIRKGFVPVDYKKYGNALLKWEC